MRIAIRTFLLVLFCLPTAARAQVKSISVGTGGVL
jgi:hypothetical protein